MPLTIFAAIDIGSTELSLKIFEIIKHKGIHELEYIRHGIKLGSDTYRNGKISNTLINELCQVLKNFTLKLKEYNITNYVAYSTSAIREASNRLLVIEQLRIRTGIQIQIISNSEQRLLCLKAIAFKERSFNEIIQKNTAVIHSGTGSIQITLFSKGNLLCTQNIRLGSLKIRELLGNLKNMTNDYKNLLLEYINNELLTFSYFYFKNIKIENIIAMGEQLNNILALTDIKENMNAVTVKKFIKKLDNIYDIPFDTLTSKAHLTKEQVELLLPTTLIYHRILEESKAEHIYLCDISLCDGIAAEYAEKKFKMKSEHDFTNDIICCVKNIAARYHCNKIHNDNIEYLALKIFDSSRTIHGLGNRDRLLLKIACTLHNCGDFINMNHSRKNSYNIIMSTEIIGLSHEERKLVANLIRYTTSDFQKLLRSKPEILTGIYLKTARLFAIFSIAHILDKSHKQKLKNIKISLKENKLIITANTLEDITLEYGLFDKKASFFEEVYGIRPYLKQKRRLL